jgi:hypothetical protein
MLCHVLRARDRPQVLDDFRVQQLALVLSSYRLCMIGLALTRQRATL